MCTHPVSRVAEAATLSGSLALTETQKGLARMIKRIAVHGFQAIAEGALIALVVVALVAGTTFAAKGGSKPTGGSGGAGGGTLAVKMVIDNNGNGSPNWNDWITFDVSTTATDKPWVKVECTGYTSSAGFFSSYAWNPYFDLASTAWTSGANICTATLYMYGNNGKVTNLKSMTFDVAA